MNDSVKKLLKESMWDLATCANGEPNVVPVAFKDVTPDGKLVVGDVFLDTTLKNLAANGGKIAVSVYDEGMPEDETNVPFYEKHGFRRMEHGAAIQICNYADKALKQKESPSCSCVAGRTVLILLLMKNSEISMA